MPSPKTATLRLEIVNDDGSKTIVTTSELDASKLPAWGARDDSPERIIVGMVDPYFDENDFSGRRDWWVNSMLAIDPPRETHFNLNCQLPPVDKSKHVYQIQEIEAPDTSVVMTTDGQGTRMFPCNFDEKTAARKAEKFGTSSAYDTPIYFLLEIP